MSSLKDLASLIMIPSLVKDGRLDTVKPLGNEIIHPDATGNNDGTDGSTPSEGNFTFSRGSNLAATRVDVNGLIEKGRENLVTYSNQFNNWYIDNIETLTGNQSGYNGNDAWRVVPSSYNGTHIVRKSSAAYQGLQTYSVYAKTAGYDIQLRATGIGGTNLWTSFDLTNGVVGSSGNGPIDSVITSVGNGWYRCSMTIESGSNVPYIGIYIVEDGATAPQAPIFIGDGSGVYIQDSQAEKGLVATDYIETGASTAQSGILEDLPRLDYSGSCPALLLEPQRTNVLPYSEYFNTWQSDAGELKTANTIESPEGLMNGNTLRQNNGASQLNVYKVLSVTSGANYCFSVWLKKKSTNQVQIYQYSTNTPVGFASRATIDFDAGTITNVDGSGATIEPYENGWFRCSIKCASPSTSLSNGVYTATAGQADVYVYGAQVEAGSYPTSYIPTYGSAVTRSYDTLNDLDLDGMFSGDSYTILFDIDLNTTFNNKVFAEAKKSTGSSSFTFRNFSGLLRVYNNLDSNYLTGSIASDSNKWVVRIDGSTADVFSYNSGSPTKTNGTALTTIRDFGKINFSGGPTISSLNQFLIFPTALTDAECNSLVE